MEPSNGPKHVDLIATAAKAHLSPIGMKRKGRSRVWLKDNGWWLAVVEFQPSGWSQGTYLNVAAHWLWHPGGHLSFDEYERVKGFAEFTDPREFTRAAAEYASAAAAEVQSLQQRFSTVQRVAAHLQTKADGNPWHHFHAMMASLAIGNLDEALRQQRALSQIEHNVPWCNELKSNAAEFMREAKDVAHAAAIVEDQVAKARVNLKLLELSAAQIFHRDREA